MLVLRNKMIIFNDSFGGRSSFEVGDVVLWSKIGNKYTGVISKLYKRNIAGRNVSFAKIFCFKDRSNCDILCLNLKLLSKIDSNTEEN